MKEADYDNISVQEFLSNAEYIILSNPDMKGVELTDSEGRIWFIQLVKSNNASVC